MTGISTFLRTAYARVCDAIWPRTCAVEGCCAPVDRDDRHVCSSCFASMPFIETIGLCRVCGIPATAEERHDFVCSACAERHPPYDVARSALRYEAPVDQLIADLKYRKATWLAEDLADFAEGAVRAMYEHSAIDAVMPVPLHPVRARIRGFNQSALIAESLSRRLNRRLDTASLVRVRDTAHQARLDAAERRTNLKDAFAVPDTRFVRGRTLLLVDDVTTTGATLRECSEKLAAAGAARIWCVTVARRIADTMQTA